MEGQGITSLAPQQGTAAPEQVDPQMFEAAKNSVTPQEFAKGSFESMSQQDPALAEAIDELMSLSLPPEMIQGLLSVLEIVLKNPEQYDQIRQYAVSQGLPEDLLPETFDAAYLQTLKMAMDALSEEAGVQGPQKFEAGGEADKNKPVPTTGAMAPPENFETNFNNLKAEIKGQYDTLVSNNAGVAYSGRESDLDTIFSAQARKLAAKGVTSIANLRNVDGNLVDSSTNTVISRIKKDRDTGATKWGDAFSGVKGGANFALEFDSSGKAYLFPVYEKSKSLGQQIKSSVRKITDNPLGKLAVGVGLAFLTGGTSLVTGLASTLGVSNAVVAGAIGGMGASALAGDKGLDIVKNGIYGALGGGAYDAYTAAGGFTNQFLPELGKQASAVGSKLLEAPSAIGNKLTGGALAGKTGIAGLIPTAIGGTALAYGLGAFDKENPNPEDLGLGFKRDVTPTQDAMAMMNQPQYKIDLGEVKTSRMPMGDFRRPFSPANYTQVSFAPRTPGLDGLRTMAQGGLVNQTTPMQALQSMKAAATGVRRLPTQPMRTMAQGGIAAMKTPVYGYVGGGTPQYPRRTGEIAGPGTGTSDDIPAMLSDGEFVFTAKAVRNMGGGDRKEGAKRMYAAMKKLENGGMA